jgi:hypothetical protein
VTRARRIDRLADLAPVLFAVPVLLGIVVSFVRLLGTEVPDLGWATTVNSDAEQLFLGHTLYQDPNVGYTGQLYTPLFPGLVSLLHHVHLWSGWPLVVTMLATCVLLGFGAWLAYAPVDRSRETRAATLIGAIGMGGLAYWAVGGLRLSMLLEGRSDSTAWCLALVGLVLLAGVGREASTRRLLLIALLLTLGLWAKQTTVSVTIVASLWVLAGTVAGWLRVRQLLVFGLGLVVCNLAILGILNLLTDGWEYQLNFLWPTRQSTSALTTPWIKEAIRGDALAIAVFAGMVLAVGAGWLAAGRPSLLRAGTSARARVAETLATMPVRNRAAILLFVFCVLGALFGVYFRRKQGTDDNQFIGVVWATGMLAATLWGLARVSRISTWAAAGVVVLGFALVPALRSTLVAHQIKVPDLEQDVAVWPQVNPGLRAYASDHLVYDALHSDLNVANRHTVSTNMYNFVDLLASGGQPKFLVDQLLDRHFDAVSAFDPSVDTYASGFGKWEEGYIWKLNQVIASRYVAAPGGAPAGLLVRRPGAERDAWQRRCFGPFTAGGVKWRIGRGGGFWCQASPGGPLAQRGMPGPASQVRTQAPVKAASGSFALAVPRGGGAALTLVDVEARQPLLPSIWSVAVTRGKKAETVRVVVNAGAPLRVRPGADGKVTIKLVAGTAAVGAAGGAATVNAPPPPVDGKAYLSLVANQDAAPTSADLSGLRLALNGKGV